MTGINGTWSFNELSLYTFFFVVCFDYFSALQKINKGKIIQVKCRLVTLMLIKYLADKSSSN